MAASRRRRALWLYAAVACVARQASAGWIDPASEDDVRSTTSLADGKQYELVMSDEFNIEARHFYDGADPVWTALTRSDDIQTSSGLKSLQFYNHTAVTTHTDETGRGYLNISTFKEYTRWHGFNPYKKKYEVLERTYTSGMIQSWNKFCFTGGIIEASVKLPGKSGTAGLWPAFWLMGNLGRATYESSTNMVWPWSYEKCSRELQNAQEISGCDRAAHYDLEPFKGRGATEIDIYEAMGGPEQGLFPVTASIPYASMTLQIAPGVDAKRPREGNLVDHTRNVWYKDMEYGNFTTINPFFYGTLMGKTKPAEPVGRTKRQAYQADAISALTNLTAANYNEFHRFRLEWLPGKGGYLRWYLDDEFAYGIEDNVLEFMGSQIPVEPSYIIFNTAIASSWGFPPCPDGCTCECYDCNLPECKCALPPGFCDNLPGYHLVDWVRVYQDPNNTRQNTGCNPRDRPTKKWILAHEYRYKLKNDLHSLKPLKRGGRLCGKDSECGNGKCRHGKCKCHKHWLGPDCKMPHHFDDDNWQADTWYPRFELLFVPPFLAACVALLGVGLLASVVVLTIRRRRDVEG